MPEKQNEKFANVFDYLNWRGDLDFSTVGVCEVDSLIFSLLTYVDYTDVVPSEIYGVRKPPVMLTVTKRYLTAHKGHDIPSLGLILSKEIVRLLVKASKTRRFGLVAPICFVNRISDKDNMQFSAMAFSLGNGDTVVAYRGTDDTIVGWRENFNMSFIYPVPAQAEAVSFLEYVASKTEGRIYLMGHSKGGNLAVYAGVKSSPATRARIEKIYSNDGPGFDQAFVSGADYKEMRDKMLSVLPQSSIVGMLLENPDNYTVVKSNSIGLLQHDGLSWAVMGDKFIHLDSLTKNSRKLDENMEKMLAGMTREERQRFVVSLFDAIESQTGAKTLTDLNSDKMKLFKVWNALDDKSKAQIRAFAGVFVGKKKK